ncbi:DUF427 domain-containing protein [Synechococcus sp. Cruz-9H2]|uniref:DUF427 domain-containing protein n=1 Tax=unclassified Synechococcus TaxID=2626047 RepID=UPI0020CC903D|nr:MULTISPECIES: DUF427 domain-containing protein [unclassified Synechococcus]MCP9819210.1 DUF427 domain-containing protein [Synechococcus sp. Cruz-9H2]MCP9843714.1 DUF427 domain-containing protein [Synechococcus sp. Edmonson 11F2]MCP9855567.1 DUF427 domain-containing protein [Synechococcus sp. Cruz-9C9]MCP9863005.1 DUF427 domain-containing protein [Synechococcus sp. Cruz-7E5]MCP9870120.1 DUF427 domain-containing protein [Synechococcus sp. Cruz-7B9]
MGSSEPLESQERERVCDYPRPPALEPSGALVEVRALGKLLAETRRSLRVLETFHPPTYYLPPEDVRLELLEPAIGRSFCEWKGLARYYDVVVGDRRLERAVWSYPQPTAAFAALAGWFALYPALMDGCWLDGEAVIPQPGGFYGGWITSQVEGPFKGDPAHPELI